jgi:hypothetical protein
MALLTPRRLVAAALGAAALLAAMPAGWQRGWTPAVGALLWLPARPMAYGLSLVRVRLRAPDDPYPARPEELRTALESADRLQGELDAERLRADRLEAQLRELSEVVERDRRGGWRPILATVVERNAHRVCLAWMPARDRASPRATRWSPAATGWSGASRAGWPRGARSWFRWMTAARAASTRWW